jgi:hypothetical protein
MGNRKPANADGGAGTGEGAGCSWSTVSPFDRDLANATDLFRGALWACKLNGAMRYRYVVRIGPEDIGRRVVVRWRRPAASGSGEDEVADVVGPLEACDDNGFAVRNQRGELVLIPRERAMAAKVIPERA